MTVWTMSHIVKHSSKRYRENCLINDTFVALFLWWFVIGFIDSLCDWRIFMLLDEHGNVLLCKMPCSQTMLKSSIDSSWKYPKQASKLLYISEPLKVRSVNELPNLLRKLNEAINWVEYFPVFLMHWRYSWVINAFNILNKF